MGRLADFRDYIVGRQQVLSDIERALCKLQEKYEQFYAEVSRVREAEVAQLRDHILADRGTLPADFNKALDLAWGEAEATYLKKVKVLEREIDIVRAKAESQRRASIAAEGRIREKNVKLDQQEERLKARNQKLLSDIADFNARIRGLGRGFGFFKNFFSMRALQRERQRLDKEQADVAAQIEVVRARWETDESGWADKERSMQEKWVEVGTEAAALEAKLEHLRAARERIVERSALEQVLFSREPALQKPSDQDPACPRCKARNPKSHHFCAICAERLQKDKPDFEGSLLELAELNRHFDAFSDGMRACQEIIGLVRGLKTGHANFLESVDDMITTERKYPVGKLTIDVPDRSVKYGKMFDELVDYTKPTQALHPKAFAAGIATRVSKVFTEDKIKTYFETMGEELSTQADRQW